MIDRVCCNCGSLFKSGRFRKYCSRPCLIEAQTTVPRRTRCIWCTAMIDQPATYSMKQLIKYCSIRCRKQGVNYKKTRVSPRDCGFCGAAFLRRKDKPSKCGKYFCSLSCSQSYTQKQKRINAQDNALIESYSTKVDRKILKGILDKHGLTSW